MCYEANAQTPRGATATHLLTFRSWQLAETHWGTAGRLGETPKHATTRNYGCGPPAAADRPAGSRCAWVVWGCLPRLVSVVSPLPAPPPAPPRNPCVTLQRSSNTLASRRPWIAGSRRLSSRTLCRRGQLQPRQPRQRPGGGGQAGEPRRAGLPAGGAPAVAARPWQPPAVPKFHQRPRGLGVDQQWGAAGPPRAGHS